GVFINARGHAGGSSASVSMHCVLWGLHQHTSTPFSIKHGKVSMHCVLWGLHQQLLDLVESWQKKVSMHCVLWGLHQPRSLSYILKSCFLKAIFERLAIHLNFPWLNF
ncbi:MAG: hypothetical protein AAB316_24925, partial [Bacteroidota bacterium]